MKLRDLFGDGATIEAQAEATAITGLAVDSRLVRPGDLFFALAGANTDGVSVGFSVLFLNWMASQGATWPRITNRRPIRIVPPPYSTGSRPSQATSEAWNPCSRNRRLQAADLSSRIGFFLFSAIVAPISRPKEQVFRY